MLRPSARPIEPEFEVVSLLKESVSIPKAESRHETKPQNNNKQPLTSTTIVRNANVNDVNLSTLQRQLLFSKFSKLVTLAYLSLARNQLSSNPRLCKHFNSRVTARPQKAHNTSPRAHAETGAF